MNKKNNHVDNLIQFIMKLHIATFLISEKMVKIQRTRGENISRLLPLSSFSTASYSLIFSLQNDRKRNRRKKFSTSLFKFWWKKFILSPSGRIFSTTKRSNHHALAVIFGRSSIVIKGRTRRAENSRKKNPRAMFFANIAYSRFHYKRVTVN